MNLYCVHDKISNSDILFSLAPNDGAYVRWACSRLAIPFPDCECRLVIENFTSDESNKIDWSIYKFPESQMRNFEPFKMTDAEKEAVLLHQLKLDKLSKGL